jgi:hypothetical protein
MRGIVLIGALALLCSACQPKEGTAATFELPVPTAPAAPAPDASSAVGMEFDRTVSMFDPTRNHIVWAMPAGIHNKNPWTLDVTVKHKGVVKHEEKIRLKADLVAA